MDWPTIEAGLRKTYRPTEVKSRLIEPLSRLLPATVRLANGLTQPKLTKFIPIKPTEKQSLFLQLDCLDAFYGGAGGGGKSSGLLAGALQFADVPGYSALLMRKTYSDLSLPGGLMDRARDWLAPTGARWKDHEKTWYLPTEGKPATLTFGYLENPNDKYRYGSSEFQFIALDEMTQFLEIDFKFMFSRLRKLIIIVYVPLRMRGGSNPVGPGRLWVKQRYVDPVTREDRIFVPAKIEDNPYLDEPSYLRSLENLDPITRAQIKAGDWEAQASGKFRRHWFRTTRAIPMGCRMVRYWDLAATEPAPGKDPSWTAGVLIGESGGLYFIVDVIRDRLTPKGVEDLVKQTADVDGPGVAVRMEQEPGSSGVAVIDHYMKLLAGYDFKGDKVTGPRELRANAMASQAEAGNVILLTGEWNRAFLDEIEVFPGGGHDDQVTAACGAFNELTGVPPVDTSGILLIGERLSPDW